MSILYIYVLYTWHLYFGKWCIQMKKRAELSKRKARENIKRNFWRKMKRPMEKKVFEVNNDMERREDSMYLKLFLLRLHIFWTGKWKIWNFHWNARKTHKYDLFFSYYSCYTHLLTYILIFLYVSYRLLFFFLMQTFTFRNLSNFFFILLKAKKKWKFYIISWAYFFSHVTVLNIYYILFEINSYPNQNFLRTEKWEKSGQDPDKSIIKMNSS